MRAFFYYFYPVSIIFIRMKYILVFIYLFIFSFSFSQEENKSKVVDSLFREDQFYVSISYNLVQNRPNGFKQFSFSPGITLGFLRDFPFTKGRKWSVAPGFGYNYNNIKQFINSNDLEVDDLILANTNEIIRTWYTSHSLEIPLELRWRNATPTQYKYWRVHVGFKVSYVLSSKLKFESESIKNKNNKIEVAESINKWQYGAYLGLGYNTWNPYVYYGLNPIFKDGSKLSNLNFGFIFYIL